MTQNGLLEQAQQSCITKVDQVASSLQGMYNNVRKHTPEQSVTPRPDLCASQLINITQDPEDDFLPGCFDLPTWT